ncbi:MAG: galactokinase [Lachnospiraceae bacterium]|nr:galactokinase [Lachnospiraceae bacterium]
MTSKELKELFAKTYGKGGEIGTYFAPGRVNLIGEHTDYNGGHVFPCALTIGTYGAIRVREDDVLRFFSVNFPNGGVVTSSIHSLAPGKDTGWANYPKGVVWAFEQKGHPLPSGADILVCGNIPAGSGLSSSASLEVLTGLMLSDSFGLDIPMEELALIGQFSENTFNGMNCGIMDQFASAMGQKDCAIFLDTNTLEYEYAPMKLDGIRVVVTNSNVKHSLVTSEYNTRRRQCEQALTELQEVVDIPSLGALTTEMFDFLAPSISDPVIRKRAKHAVYENRRTIDAVDALKAGNIELFGKLMNASHVSLRDDFEVSCREMDVLAEEAWKIDGCLGSRITGGGFGGCTVSLVKEDAIDAFISQVGAAYTKRTGLKADFYVVDIGQGAHAIL